jgi:uncharacterized protein (TIGR02569 family)
MSPPSEEVLHAFGLNGTPELLSGGRGLCYSLGDTVFKPSDDSVEAQWVAENATRVLQSCPTAYRLSLPIHVVNQPNTFIFKGWIASSFVRGTPTDYRQITEFGSMFLATRAFHADLATLGDTEKPRPIKERFNRWDEADKVTWGEKSLHNVTKVDNEMLTDLSPMLNRLSDAILRPLPDSTRYQLIHGDLTGNVLFGAQPGEPPAIIDLTFYWRPVEYSEAIIVADCLAWRGAGRDLVELYGTDEFRMQLLARALYWRLLTFAIDPDRQWIEENMPKSDYKRALVILSEFIEL